MTRQEVIELIDQFIYANANNEITANTLNPVLDAIVNQSNDLIGDITQLTTSDTDNLVAAINSILNDVQLENGNTVKVWRGQENPNTVSPPDSKEADFYIQTDPDDESLVLWQYFNGYWRNNEPIEPDRFIQLSTIDLSSNIVYVNPVFKWIIAGLPNSNEDVRDFPISPAGTGESRIDILLALPNDSIIKREGIPSAGSGTAVAPAYAEGQGELLLTTISIYEDNIQEEPVNPTLGRYVTYSSYQFTTIFSETDNYIAPNQGKSSYEIKQIGGTRTLLGISGSFLSTPSNEDFISEGKPIVIFNNSGESAVLKNNASIGSDYRFINPDGNDHVSEYGSITTYIPRGLELIFASYSRSQGGGSGTVQSVTALNPLAVNNSDPANPVLNVTTPEVAQLYATTAENNAKSYADALVVGLLDDRGNYDASTNLFPSTGGSGTSGTVLKGDLWTVSVAGTLGGISVGIGDVVRALVNTPGQTSSNWVVTEHNFGYVAENQANKSDNGSLGTSTTSYPTQRAVKEYVDSMIKPWLDMPIEYWVQATGASLGQYGIGSIATYGDTVTDLFSTNFLSYRRIVSTATAGKVIGIRDASFNRILPGAAFYFECRVKANDASLVTDLRLNIGFGGVAIPANTDISANNQGFGLMADSADTNLSIGYRNASLAYAKINLGTDFVKNNTDEYFVSFFRKEINTDVFYNVKNLTNGAVRTGSFSAILTQALSPNICRMNAASNVAIGLDFHRIKIHLKD